MDLISGSHIEFLQKGFLEMKPLIQWSCTQNFDSYFQIIFPKQLFSLKKKKKKASLVTKSNVLGKKSVNHRKKPAKKFKIPLIFL